MNDLNSVFIVGRVDRVRTIKGRRMVTLINRRTLFADDGTTMEEVLTLTADVTGLSSESKRKIKKNIRIGLNGRLSVQEGRTVVSSFSVSILDAGRKS